MFNGQTYEYTCVSCGNYGSAFVDWCRCEKCGALVECTIIKSNNMSDNEKEGLHGD